MSSKKALAVELSKLKLPSDKKIHLEQYETEGDIAAEVLWTAYMNGDIKDKVVADLGCGNGIFGVGALLLGAEKVFFVDVDEDMIELAKENSKNKGEFLNIDVVDFDKKVDTVLMNPPFGVKVRKADKIFLQKAMENSNRIYSIHKIESKKFIDKISSEFGFETFNIIDISFLLKKTFNFHKMDKYFVDVGCWCIKRK